MKRQTDLWQKRTSTFSILVSSLIYLGLGCILLFVPRSFQTGVSLAIALLLLLDTVASLLRVVVSLSKGWRSFWSSALRGGATVVLAGWILSHLTSLWELLPLLLGLFFALLGISSFISFWQYRHEYSTGPLRHLVSALLSLGFSFTLFCNLKGSIVTTLVVSGIYLILYSLTLFEDFLSELLPQEQKNHLKRRIRIPLPVFLTAFLPAKMLQRINQYLSASPEGVSELHQEKGEDVQPNVEVFVHVAPKGAGSVGHVDLCVLGHCISYGGYDENAMKLGGAIGPGVVFIHHNREAYLRFCQENSQKTLFCFGLLLKEEELEKMRAKLQEILSDAVPWAPRAQLVEEGRLPNQVCTDYGSKLYLATGAKFYKFQRGSFRHYWVLGTNCVRFADGLLYASGTDTLAAGIISPGTYYEFLNREFERKGGRVIQRTVYPCQMAK